MTSKKRNELLFDIADKATQSTLKGVISDFQIESFLNKINSDDTPSPIYATGSVAGAVIFDIECHPMASYHWKHVAGGPGVGGIYGEGFLYTSYSSWDQLWENTRSCMASGLTTGGGLFIISFFDHNHQICGQFRASSVGIATFTIGSGGHWHKNK